MISTPPSALVPDAETAHTSAVHPRQASLDGLIHAGVVTHLVRVEESLDPLFAIAQMRDMPEIQFVAAFEDGLIALGCPEKLPEDLKELATPAKATSGAASPLPEDALKRIDRTAQQLDYLIDAVRPDQAATDENRLRPLLDRLGAIEERLAQQSSANSIKSMKEQLTGLHKRFDKLADATEQVSAENRRPPDDPGHLAALEMRLGAIESGMQSLAEHLSKPNQSEALGAIREALDQLKERPSADPSLTQIPEVLRAVDEIAAKLDKPPSLPDALTEKLSTLTEGISQLTTAPAPQIDLSAQEAKFEQFATVLAMLVNRIEGSAKDIKETVGQAGSSAALDAFGVKLDRIVEEIKPPEPVDLAPVMDRIEGISSTLSAWPEALADLRTDMKVLAEQPKPVLDLTEQRRTFATFSSTLSGVVQRLETVATDISAQEPAKPDLSEVNEAMQSLLQQIEALTERQPDLTPITAQLDELLSHAKSQPEVLAAFDEKLDILAKRPAPVLDLTAQRSDFARFGTVLSNVVKRVEAAFEAQGDKDSFEELHASLSKIAARIDVLPDQETFASRLREEFTELQKTMSLLADQPASVDAALESLREDISALLKRPDPVLDLTAQRQGFARFGAALNTALERLETVTTALEADDEEQPNPATEIIAVVQALPEILDSTVRQATDLEPVINALISVQHDLASLPHRIGLSDLNDAVTSLTRRPDPIIDLTAQRQSFARFGTAISTVIERLDGIAQDLAAAGADPSQFTAFTDAVTRVEMQLSDGNAAQKSKFDTLSRHVMELSDQIQGLATPPSVEAQDQADPRVMITLDDLRLQFAELIAAQIKQNAASFQPGTDIPAAG